MAINKQRKTENQSSDKSLPSVGKTSGSLEKYLVPASLLLVTWIVYSPVLKAGFINWDDPSYILYNPLLKEFGWESIKFHFSNYFLANYHPLTMVVYSAVGSIFGESATAFHSLNILIHLANTLLVFKIAQKILHQYKWMPLIASLLFAVHPMHLESVAWISELKDQLYSFFLLMAILLYQIRENHPKKLLFYLLCLLSFIFSLLSKGQAVILPVILLLFDYLNNKKLSKNLILEKIPFFILSLIFGIIAVLAQKEAVNEAGIPLIHQVLFRFYAFFQYFLKAFLPINLSGFHEFPYSNSGSIPFYIYTSPLIVLAALYLLFRYRSNRYLVFGGLFFILSLLPILLVPVGKSFIAERYTYIPYIGLFFIISGFSDKHWFPGLKSNLRSKLVFLAPVLIFVSCFITYSRAGVWKDSLSFWTDVSKSYPNSTIALEHQAMYNYYEGNNLEAAIGNMDASIKIDSTYSAGYRLSGFFYQQAGSHEIAINRFNKGLKIDSLNVDMYLYRGNSWKAIGDYEKALADYERALVISPKRVDLWIARGALMADNLKQYDNAILDYKKAISIDNAEPNALYNIAVAYYMTAQYDSSLLYADKALLRNNKISLLVRSLSLYKKGDYISSLKAAEMARNEGLDIPDSLLIAR
ncbi:MAG: tetratricopeptide repeat protein [Bacteroidales bacterium]|nr:tetratricopeptide repeat protein [Bacteroidales bacterium]